MEKFIVIRDSKENSFFGIAQAIRFMSDVICPCSLTDLLRIARERKTFGQGVCLFTDRDEAISFKVE